MRIGGAVDGVDHREQPGVALAGRARFLGEHGQTRAVQHREGRTVGRQVEPVLAGLSSRGPPVLECVQRCTHGGDGVVEHLEQAGIVHGRGTLMAIVAPARLIAFPPAAIRLPQLWLP